MQTHFTEADLEKPHLREADRVLRSCVHCGFCNATCPTYLLLGDERDGPRGRIYLMKELLESRDDNAEITSQTQLHLDRCLTCLNCETTCPSGALRDKMPAKPLDAGKRPEGKRHVRQMLILAGCVQSGLSPNTNAATARVLDRLGIGLTASPQAGCCGALEYHLNAQQAGLDRARANIDAWWPAIENGCEAIIQTASGCGAFVKDYAGLLAEDSDYAKKAERVSRLTKDLVEVLREEDLDGLKISASRKLAFHCPCTLQHAQKLAGAVEQILLKLGFELAPVRNAHLCCGSAGTYSITQPELARQLRDNKHDALEAGRPELIVTANIGCQTHLNGAGRAPVRHWIEVVDEALRTYS